jgi:single-stranded-DNA-specific exonuclease
MLWGQDFDESYIVLEGVEIPAESIHVLSKNNKYRVQILYKGIEIIKFNLTEEEIDFWQQIKGSVTLNILGTCTVNEWCGRITPQLLIKDTEVLKTKKYIF